MKSDHITDILDSSPFTTLSDVELEAIRTHSASCDSCAQAFQAAHIASVLMEARASESTERAQNVNPFFQTRVLAAWREQQASAGAWNLRRLWKSTGAIVASMAVTTAALAVLTFVAPATEVSDQPAISVVSYSTEAVVFQQDQDDAQMTNDQIINAIYADDDEGK